VFWGLRASLGRYCQFLGPPHETEARYAPLWAHHILATYIEYVSRMQCTQINTSHTSISCGGPLTAGFFPLIKRGSRQIPAHPPWSAENAPSSSYRTRCGIQRFGSKAISERRNQSQANWANCFTGSELTYGRGLNRTRAAKMGHPPNAGVCPRELMLYIRPEVKTSCHNRTYVLLYIL
jgi:hypothetical protein